MNYRVEWSARAEQMLADIWIASNDRKRIAAATHEFDLVLATHPLQIGESRSSSVHRLAFLSLLGIEYTVIEDDKRVTVMAVFASN